jgi:hypothetical protein
MSDPAKLPAQAQAEFRSAFEAFITSLSMLEKLEKRTRDPDALTTVGQANDHLRDAYLDLSAVQRAVNEQGILIKRLLSEQQVIHQTYQRVWQERLNALLIQFPDEEHAQLRLMIEFLMRDGRD